jgi:hypothetical protein
MSESVQAKRLETVLLVPSAETRRSSLLVVDEPQELGVQENHAGRTRQTEDGIIYLSDKYQLSGSNKNVLRNAVTDGDTTVDELMEVAKSYVGEKMLATEFVNAAFKYPRTASKRQEVLVNEHYRYTHPTDGKIFYGQVFEIATAWDPCDSECDGKVHFDYEESCVDPEEFVELLATETFGREEYEKFKKAKASWFRGA